MHSRDLLCVMAVVNNVVDLKQFSRIDLKFNALTIIKKEHS